MTIIERQLAVGIVLSLTIAVRLIAHHEAGGMFRDQSDGVNREGRWVALLARLVFLIGGLGGVVVWFVAPGALPGGLALPGWTGWLGLIAAETGLVLLMWVHLCLGVHFSGTLHLREDHRLVTSGPYARIRHPMYTAFLLLLGGLGVMTTNLFLLVLLLGSQVWVLGWRLPQEERMLAEQFGPQWERYRQQTGAVLPFL